MDFPGQFGDHILPDNIHKINVSFIVNKFEKRRGGTAGNVSYSMGLLKIPHILFSVVGKDFSEYKKTFTKLGIDTSKVRIEKKEHTATGFAMTDRDNNQIWAFFYGASEKSPLLSLKKIATKKGLVLVGPAGAVRSMNMIDQASALGIPYMFDPGFILTQISDVDLEKGVRNATYLIGNDYELDVIRKRMLHAQNLFENQIIITTLGKEGACIEADGKKYFIDRAPAKRVVDPTGAGDAWRSGFLAGLELGKEMQICGQMGSVAASFAIEEYGTQEHRYTKKEFQERYKEAYASTMDW